MAPDLNARKTIKKSTLVVKKKWPKNVFTPLIYYENSMQYAFRYFRDVNSAKD